MYFLIVCAVLNTILDLWFVISFGWGVVGVAVATVLAQAVCAAFSIFYMFRRYPIFRFRRRRVRVRQGESSGICLRLGIPAIIQQAVVSLGNVFIQRLVNGFGQVTMSAFNAGNRMEAYALIPVFGMNNAAASFAGPERGRGEVRPRARAGWQARPPPMSVLRPAWPSPWRLYFLAPDFARLFSPQRRGPGPGGGVPAPDQLLHDALRHLHAHLRPAAGRGRRDVDLASAAFQHAGRRAWWPAYVMAYALDLWAPRPAG